MPNIKAEHLLGFSGMYLLYQKVMVILKFQFACNYSVNLNFDTQYLRNARSDLHEVFASCLSFRSLSEYYIKF